MRQFQQTGKAKGAWDREDELRCPGGEEDGLLKREGRTGKTAQ
jgi:hypothetical protein